METPRGEAFSPSLYVEPQPPHQIHLWYLAPSEDLRTNDLMHAVSAEGHVWNGPVRLSGTNLENDGTILHASVSLLDDAPLLCYLVRHEQQQDEDEHSTESPQYEFIYQFRTMRDGKNWVRSGPPDLRPPIGTSSEFHFGAPAAIVTDLETRILFEEETVEGGKLIRSAVFAKKDERKHKP